MTTKRTLLHGLSLMPARSTRGERAVATRPRRVKASIISIALGLLASAVLFCSTPAHAAAPVIPLYHATYSVSRNDLRIGNTQFSLTKNKDGTYTYESVTQPAGLVSLFRSDVITETSHFSVVDDRPRSLLYSYTHTGGGDNKPQSIRFDWNKKLAYSNNSGKHRTLQLESGICDRLLAQLLISLDAAHGSLNNDYRVLDHGEMQPYRLHEVGVVKLKTPAGEFDTVEVARKDEKKDRVTTFWLALKLDYLPVQMQQTETGKATISLVLTKIKLDTK